MSAIVAKLVLMPLVYVLKTVMMTIVQNTNNKNTQAYFIYVLGMFWVRVGTSGYERARVFKSHPKVG